MKTKKTQTLYPNNHEPIEVSNEDMEKITRGLGFKGIVKDVKTGEHFNAYGASCDLPTCYCAVDLEKI